MQSAKEAAKAMPASVLDDVKAEDAQYTQYVRDVLKERLAAVDRGEVISHEEVVRRMAKWLD